MSPEQVSNGIWDSTQTTGTGPFALDNNPPTNYRSISQIPGIAVNDTLWCHIRHREANEWLYAKCTYSAANQLTVTEVEESHMSGNAVPSFTSGYKDIILVIPASWYRTIDGGSY
jgi:hypothetical protein